MANSELINKSYNIPPDILNYIRSVLISNPTGDGVKRAKFILKNGSLTYQAIKRLKNFFDNFNPSKDSQNQYVLAGGNLMRNFVDRTLNSDRSAIEQSKKIKREMTVDVNLGTKAFKSSPNLNEEEVKKNENAIAVIINKNNKILLAKRRVIEGGWGNGKYALIGGGVENNEKPKDACLREIREETNLHLKNAQYITTINNSNSIDNIFLCQYYGNPFSVELNEEHTAYGWYDLNEIEHLNTVPNLKGYIQIATVLI